jgi:hypothetical protein
VKVNCAGEYQLTIMYDQGLWRKNVEGTHRSGYSKTLVKTLAHTNSDEELCAVISLASYA